MICAFEVEEITTVAETRLPPWAKKVFPSVRAHMPWMDTPAGPIELLIGLDNSQWLPVCLEDSKEPAANMRLMKVFIWPYVYGNGGLGHGAVPTRRVHEVPRRPIGRMPHPRGNGPEGPVGEMLRGEISAGTQERGEGTHQRALQPSAGAPSAEQRRTRMRRSRTRGSRWPSATTGTNVPPPHGDARPVAATRTQGSGPEAGPHDCTDGTRDAAGV